MSCVRQSDAVSRLGGDEFAIVQTNLNSEYGVEVLARRIINEISQPFDIDGERIFTGTSIGITLYPNDGQDGDGLIRTPTSRSIARNRKAAIPTSSTTRT